MNFSKHICVSDKLFALVLSLISLGYISLTQHHLIHEIINPAAHVSAIPYHQHDDKPNQPTGDNVNESCIHCLVSKYFSVEISPALSFLVYSKIYSYLGEFENIFIDRRIQYQFDPRGPPLLFDNA